MSDITATPTTEPRLDLEWNWWSINRLRLDIYPALDDNEAWVSLSLGNGNSDPVWRIAVRLAGWMGRKLVAYDWWRYARRHPSMKGSLR